MCSVEAGKRVHTGKEVFTSQVAKCECLSNIRTSPPLTPLLARSLERTKKTQNICFEKDIKLTWGAVCVPLPCTFQQLHVGAWQASTFQHFGCCGRSMSPDMVDHLHLQNRIKKRRDTQQLIIKETFPFLTLKRSQISWIPRPPCTIQIP